MATEGDFALLIGLQIEQIKSALGKKQNQI
jgi:hypothetical protein